MGTTLYGSVGAHGSTTDYWAAVGVTEQKAARSCLRLMSPCEESVPERAGNNVACSDDTFRFY